MVELSLRLLILCAATAATWLLSPTDREFTLQLAAVLATGYAFVALLEKRDLRTAPVSTVLGIVDAATLGWMLSRTGTLGVAGAAVAIPIALTHRRFPTFLGFAAPLVAAVIPIMAAFGTSVSSNSQVAHTLGALTICCIGAIRLRSKSAMPDVPDLPIPAREPDPISNLAVIRQIADEHCVAEETNLQPEPDVLELRENYRRLREHAQDLEERARRERLAMRLLDLDAEPGETPFCALAGVIREFSGARGVTLYTCMQRPGALTVSASSGDVPFRVRSERIVLNDFRSDVRLRAHAVAHLRDPEDESPTCAVLLKHRGSLIGLIWLSGDHQEQLNAARDRAEDASEILSRSLVHVSGQQSLQQRASHLELLYSVAGIAEGADTARTLMTRVARELFSSFPLDHLGFTLLDGDQTIQVATEGAALKALEAIRVGQETGLAAWKQLQFMEILTEDAHTCPQIPSDEAIKRRIGSLMVVPIFVEESIYGILTAVTHRKGGIDGTEAERLRLVAAEVGLAIERLEGRSVRPSGIALASEFQSTAVQGNGAIIVLEPLRAAEILSVGGPASMERALQEFCSRLRVNLPHGGMLHRREGDVLVYIPEMELTAAQQWANQAVTLAALMQVPISGVPGIPVLALQARASEVGDKHANRDHEITSSIGGPA